jgi:chaperonin GroES
MKLLFDRVLIKPIIEEPKSTAGLILVKFNKEKSLRGEVISIGPDVIKVTVGDIVFIPPHSGTTVEIQDKEHLIMDEEEILAKWEN